MLIRLLLQALLVIVLVRALWRLLKGVLEGAGVVQPRQARGPGGAPAVPLVRDPVCGTFVVPSRALSSGAGAERQYFCSERCRDRYASERRRA